jgi:hypothetical protein
MPESIIAGARHDIGGFTHGWSGATIVYYASETIMPRCPKAPPPQVSVNNPRVGM